MLTLLVALSLGVLAAPEAPPAPAAPIVNEIKAATGLVVSADLRAEYVAGFPLLVTVTVRNDTSAPLTFPDLSARPHLVHFHMKKDAVRWERYTTPPTVEPTNVWTIQPRAQRKVILEIPSSGGLDAGQWELGVEVKDPAGALVIPNRPVRLSAAKPVGGSYAWESTIQQTTGAMIPWVHQAASGFDLYLLQLAPRPANRVLGQFHLLHLDAKADPVLTRARPTEATSRYIYWVSGAQDITLARLEGSTLRAAPRTIAVPYPKSELLGRGVTDAKGGVIIPLWIPDPAGTSGTVRAMCVDERGTPVLREVTHLAAKPSVVMTSPDAASNLLIGLGHGAAIDLYRVDPTLAPEIGARGTRVAPMSDGWTPAALAFDTLPESPSHPGGLALLSLATKPGPSPLYRAVWSDLAGKVIQDSGPLPWTAPGTVQALLPAGFGPFYYTTTDGSALFYGVQGAQARKVDGGKPGVLWPSADAVSVRRIVDGTVFEDRVLGPISK
jgi:hypothetical protein